MSEHIAVLGAGSWGIAIANLLNTNGHKVRLWEFSKTDCDNLIRDRMHNTKLPGILIPHEIQITNNLPEAVETADIIVLAVPAQTMRAVCESLDTIIKTPKYYINLAKGLEVNTLLRMSQLIEKTITSSDKNRIATLSGPSHAEEVTRDMPTSVVAASVASDFTTKIQTVFNGQYFRVYSSVDIIGVELGGSLKNVIAIGSGIIQGLGFGDNTAGALLTRGLAEISRMGAKLGADPLTFAGLSGIGDLITTCLSRHSRNRFVGERIGKGERLNDILDSMVMVAEGVDTCRSAYALSQKHKVEMPITVEVYRVLFDNKPPREAVADLMGRSVKEEIWK